MDTPQTAMTINATAVLKNITFKHRLLLHVYRMLTPYLCSVESNLSAMVDSE